MSNDEQNATLKDYKKPEGAFQEQEIKLDGKPFSYEAEANWMVLRQNEEPAAEMFYIRYSQKKSQETPEARRPITFVFNGGPGASSVYLHLGAVGPKRVAFRENGTPLPMPVNILDNQETWLRFTDLVFIDPIGTGFSRLIKKKGDEKEQKKDEKASNEYLKLQKDLDSLGEFIRRFLSASHRWESPVYIAGESYGGFRVGKLAKLLQQDYGVGLCGAILISPALEFQLLDPSDYDVLPWLDMFPSMAAAAAFHGKSRRIAGDESIEEYMKRASAFGLKELLPVLAGGSIYPEQTVKRVLNSAADFLGLPRDTVCLKNGRIDSRFFVKNLLREQGVLLGLYDATMVEPDPFPDRDGHEGPDPTLHSVERIFAAGINTQLRKEIGLETDREYRLLSTEVNKAWKVDTRNHALESQVGATDDLRYGMSLNPDMKVYITHGYYDLVTPFFAADRISNLMKLSQEAAEKLTVRHYPGGHMFYTWDESRKGFFADIREFYGN